MRFISLIVGKLILGMLRLLGRSGSALPGLVVEKIHPKFLGNMLENLPDGVIVITGTNGKTTTTKSLASLLEAQGKKVLTNKTGSNFVRGTVTTAVDKASIFGKLKYDIAVFEQDEAHAVHFVHRVQPKGVVILNIMRDQMDRFGEIDTTAKLLSEVVQTAKSWVLLNANDERVSMLKPQQGVRTYWYGHSEKLKNSFLTDDQLHHIDSQLFYKAAECDVELEAYDESSVTLKRGDKNLKLPMSLVGSHNAINITAAVAALYACITDVDLNKLELSVKNLQPAFGRGETISLKDGTKITLQLVKNPGGFTHALRNLSLKDYGVVAIAINDDYADGRDVSWLWDVDFDLVGKVGDVICGGTRAHDMAVRLKYDGVVAKERHVDLGAMIGAVNKSAKNKNQEAIIFCTYTAMLKIRSLYKHYSNDVYGVEV